MGTYVWLLLPPMAGARAGEACSREEGRGVRVNRRAFLTTAAAAALAPPLASRLVVECTPSTTIFADAAPLYYNEETLRRIQANLTEALSEFIPRKYLQFEEVSQEELTINWDD